MKGFTVKTRIFPIVIYPNKIYCYIGYSPEKTISEINKTCKACPSVSIEAFEENAGYTIGLTNGSVIIYIREDHIGDYGVLAHEVFHAVESVMNYVGITHSEDSSEAFAYLIQYIMSKILE